MDEDKPDLAERLGRTVNELDIDFSRFTLAGWLVSTLSLATGCVAAWVAYEAMPKRNGPDDGPPLVLGLSLIAATTLTFLALRWASHKAGFPVIRSKQNGEFDSD